MNKLSSKTWLKIVLWAIAIHVILIVISIAEVFVYSLINPGLENAAYADHATISGPYISMIFGFILFFLITKSLCKDRTTGKLAIALTFPVIYTILDFIIVHFSGVNWKEHLTVFIISFGVKTAGAFLGAFIGFRRKQKVEL